MPDTATPHPESTGRELAREVPAREASGERGRSDEHAEPDVLLDVPVVKVDEIKLTVEDLHARVSLEAAVLDLLKLHVGADVRLGKVELDITGVEAKALLKVRLDNVAMIIRDVLQTIDNNPQILDSIGRGLETAVRDVGTGAGRAVGEVGTGAGRAVDEVGRGAGRAVDEVGAGTGRAVDDLGGGAGPVLRGYHRGRTGDDRRV